MTNQFETTSRSSIDAFNALVKSELQEILGVNIYSVESEALAGSDVAKTLDQSASSDLLIQYESDGSVFAAASRLSFCDPHILDMDFSITLRDSIDGEFAKTELNKLFSSLRNIRSGVPALLPRYLCYARINKKTNPMSLHDILAIETAPLVDHIFSPAHFNLPHLRRKMQSEESKEILLEHGLKHLAGLRTSSKNTFVFVSKKYLDQNCIPYTHRRASRSAS
ncbi:hypothetical protein [Luteimonas sp. R10]|uniref:hypothetical protein n=1 Tax=Luteimonas sp. R10 TaxID=3108176 RepID=UPI0030850A27|nr:hypothetical protein U3649_14960 [Luteimonas sp. R10]